MWLVATCSVGTAQFTCWLSSAWRAPERAMACRTSAVIGVAGSLAISSCKKVLEGSTELCTPGKEVTWLKEPDVMEPGRATWTKPDWIHCISCWGLDAMCTVMRRTLGVVPHHFGLASRPMVWAETEAISKGPPERSMAGLTEGHWGFHPTVSMMWAGSRLAKSICQSAKRAWNTTVTVRPLLLPVIDAMSR